MIWSVEADGHVLVRMRGQGAIARRLDREQVEAYVNEISTDMASSGMEVTSTDIEITRRTSSSVVDVLWHAAVPPEQVTQAQAYFKTLSQSEAGGW